MTVIADILLISGAIGAGFYCYILARRLARFTDLEKGVGGAVAILSSQVDELSKTLEAARTTAGHSTDSLEVLTDRAEGVAKRLELMVASMHDLPEPQTQRSATTQTAPNDPPEVPQTELVSPQEPEPQMPSMPMFRHQGAQPQEASQ